MGTDKSVRERIHRKLRHKNDGGETRGDPVTKASKNKSLPGRVVPKKTGNNDPRGHGRKMSENVREWMSFITENAKKSGNVLDEAVANLKNKKLCLECVLHTIASQMGGWEEQDGHFVNQSGRMASSNNWDLNEGYLKPKGKKRVIFNVDWLHEARVSLEKSING